MRRYPCCISHVCIDFLFPLFYFGITQSAQVVRFWGQQYAISFTWNVEELAGLYARSHKAHCLSIRCGYPTRRKILVSGVITCSANIGYNPTPLSKPFRPARHAPRGAYLVLTERQEGKHKPVNTTNLWYVGWSCWCWGQSYFTASTFAFYGKARSQWNLPTGWRTLPSHLGFQDCFPWDSFSALWKHFSRWQSCKAP